VLGNANAVTAGDIPLVIDEPNLPDGIFILFYFYIFILIIYVYYGVRAEIENGSVTLEYQPFVDIVDAVADTIVLSWSVFCKNIFHM
jgi:hypothetical protein